MKKTSLKALLFTSLFTAAFFYGSFSAGIALPREEKNFHLYTTASWRADSQGTLEPALLQALTEAKTSIDVSSYNLSSSKVISLLNSKAKEGLQIKVFYDKKANPKLATRLSEKVHLFPWKGKGLMHRKAVVIDHKIVFIGSANMSWSSLYKHPNLLLGLFDPQLAERLSLSYQFSNTRLPSEEDPLVGKNVTVWPLPQASASAENQIFKAIQSAKKSIRIAMYTWTRQDFAKKVAEAHSRGVKVEVLLDQNVLKNLPATRKVLKQLKEASVPVHIYQGQGLLHHKFAWIDSATLITGSANWTQRAFGENWEFLVQTTLNKKQQRTMQSIWQKIKNDSK